MQLLLLLPPRLPILRKVKPSIPLWHLILLENRLPHVRMPPRIFSPQLRDLRYLCRLILLIEFPHSIHRSQPRESLSPCCCCRDRGAPKPSGRPKASSSRGGRWCLLLLLLLLLLTKT